jgi:lipoprotein-releasing system ATP-binding protein
MTDPIAPAGSREPLLVADEVSKRFRRPGEDGQIDVLRGVHLEVHTGDRIAVVGKSGSGKSTLLQILGTLERPTGGSLRFEGRELTKLGDRSLAEFRNRALGFVFQFHYLMIEFTALENAMMPALIAGESRRWARDRATELLNRVGLGARLAHKPGQLSGGEQQRVAIARALMLRPRLLLTDEMTGNLDPVTGSQILELLSEMHAEYGMAIVSVTHDRALAARYGKVLELSGGLLVAHPLA